MSPSSSIIFILIDALSMPCVYEIQEVLSSFVPLHWDQSLNVIQFGFVSSLESSSIPEGKLSCVHGTTQSLASMCEKAGGSLYFLENLDQMNSLVQSFTFKSSNKFLQPSMNFILETMNFLSDHQIFQNIQIPQNTGKIMTVSLSLSQFYQMHKLKDCNFILPHENSQLLPLKTGFPHYYVDFSKIINFSFPKDFILMKGKINYGQLHQFWKSLSQNKVFNLSFPVFKNRDLLFGYLNVRLNEGSDISFKLIVTLPNFHNIISFSYSENYFNALPNYYLPFFQKYFQSQNFYTDKIKILDFLKAKISTELRVNNTDALIKTERLRQKYELSLKESINLHNKRNCSCISLFEIQNKRFKEIYLSNSELLFALQHSEDIAKEKDELNVNFQPLTKERLRNPYKENFELSSRKESIPYGNPFKKILKRTVEPEEEEQLISSESQLIYTKPRPELLKDQIEKPTKPNEKHQNQLELKLLAIQILRSNNSSESKSKKLQEIQSYFATEKHFFSLLNAFSFDQKQLQNN